MPGYLQQVLNIMGSQGTHSAVDPRRQLWDNLGARLSDSAAQNKEWQDIASGNWNPATTPSGGVSGGIGDILSGAGSAAGRAMDLVSRLGYAVRAPILEGIKEEGSGTNRNLDLGSLLSASWQGLEGKQKTSTSEIENALGWKTDGSSSGFNQFMHGLTGFAGDVALDPITYIPIGGLAATAGRGVARAGFEAAGKELPQVLEKGGILNKLRVKNTAAATADKAAEQVKSAPDAVTAGVQSLDQTGVAKVNSTVSDKVIAKVNGQPQRVNYPFDVAEGPQTESMSNLQRIMAGQPALNTADVIRQSGVGNDLTFAAPNAAGRHLGTAQANLAALRTREADLLKPFEGPKYGADTRIDPFTVETSREVPTTVTKTREVPSGIDPVKEATKTLQETADPATFDRANKVFKLFTKDGKPYAKDVNTGGAVAIAKKGKQGISPRQLMDVATGNGELADHLKGAHIRTQNGNLLPVHRFADMLKETHDTNALLAQTTKAEEYTTKEMQTITGTRKIKTGDEVKQWADAHTHLAPEDVKQLTQAGKKSYDAFNAAVEDVRSRMVSHQYGSLGELEKALADGTAPKEVVDEVKNRFGTKSISKLSKDLQAAEEKVASHATKAHDIQVGKDIKESQADFEKFKAEHGGMPNVEGHPELMQNVAQKIDESLAAGERPKIDHNVRETLQDWQANIVKDELKESNLRQLQIDKSHPNITKRGARSPRKEPYSTQPGEYVRWKNGFNARSQMEIVRNIVRKTGEALKSKIPDATRSDAMYDTVMPMLHAADQVMRDNGITRILGTGEYGQGIPMSMHDVLSSLDRDFAKKFYFDRIKNVTTKEGEKLSVSNNMLPTQIMDIAEQMIHLKLGNITEEQARAEIKSLLEKPGGTSDILGDLSERLGRNERGGKTAAQRLDAATTEIMAGFDKAMPTMMDKLEQNIADSVMAESHVAAKISQDAIDKFNAVVTDPTFSPGAKVKAAVDAHKFVDEAAHLENINKYHSGVQMAQTAMDAHVAKTMPMGSVNATETLVKDMGKAATKNDAVAADQKLFKAAGERAAATTEENGGNTYDFGMKALMSNAMHFIMKFVPHAGNEDLHPLLLHSQSVAQTYIKNQTKILSKLHKQFTDAELREASNSLRDWYPPMTKTPAMDALLAAQKDMFDATNGGYGWFTRNVKDPALLQEDYKMMGVPDHIKLDPNDMENSWRQWEPTEKGPLDLYSRITAAHTHAMAKANLGSELSEQWGSKIAQPGYVKIVASGKERNSELIKYINTDLYYPEDIAKQMHILDTTLEAIRKGDKSSSPTARNLLKNLDIATQMWKAGVTIYRPGHHVRNAIGDIWLASMDGVTPGYYKKAAQVIATRQGQYPDFNGLRAATHLGSSEKLPGTILTLKFGNEVRHFTPDQVYRMMDTAGGLPSFDVIEDVSLKQPNRLDPRTGAGVLGKLQNVHLPGPLEGKAHKLATNVSEGREHVIRIAHFLHAMEEAPLKGKTFDEALKNATFDSVQRVRRWHPDGSDLTQFERRYMRRLIPFYSWTRKAIPLVLETAVQKPGMAMLYPKAMYNWAAAKGINLNGYGDAFPTDQIFPSWISDSVQGPTWGSAGAYAGIKPGVPIMDIADDYLANPKATWQNVIGQTHPFLRVPIEMMTKTKLRTGGPISDMSDYIDQQIPGGSYLDALAGNRSLSTGFLQANKVAPSNVGYQSQSVPQFPVGGSAILNWLTGLGFTDYSKPSYEKFAQLEQKKAGG